MVSLSAEGEVTGWNAGAERFLGYSPDEVRGRALSSLAQDPPAVERSLSRLRRTESVHTVCLTTYLINQGRSASVFLCVDALREQHGRVEGFLVTLRDVRSVVFEPGTQGAHDRLTVPDPGALQGLTPRQRLVLELIARGHSTREIAKRLDRSVKTVETHRAQLMKRLNVHHVPGLVRFAIRAGLVTID